MIARLQYWYWAHPRWGRPALLLAMLQGLALTAVCAAPQASAASNAMVLNWTGLHDSYGVPIGDYYLSIASLPEQITQAGPHVTANPDTWAQWVLHASVVTASYFTTANILTAEAGAFIGIIALALWVMKITVATYWLSVIGAIAHAITDAVIAVTTAAGLLLLAIPLGVFTGAITVKRGEVGRGWTMIGTALAMPAASVAVFADPAGDMYGPNGLLAFGRRVGFSVAQAATHNGSLGGGTTSGGRVDGLTASLLTHVVREPLQLWNFGHVVDRVGGCGPAWSHAVHTGAPDAPIRAMSACGDTAAVSYAQHLDGTNIWVGAVFVATALLLALFMVASGWAVLKVSVKAIWTTCILLPSLWLGAIPGAPQRRAMDVVWQFFRHGIEVLVYIVYVSVIGLAVERIVSRPLPAELGGTNPFAHVLMMGGVSVAAFVLLRHIRADLSGGSGGRGMVGRAADLALGMGTQSALGATGSAALSGGKHLLGRARGGRGTATPWEQLDAAADHGERVHGPPESGVEPVPGADSAVGVGAAGAGGASVGHGGAGGAVSGGELSGASGSGVASVLHPTGGDGARQPAPAETPGVGRNASRQPSRRRGREDPEPDPNGPADGPAAGSVEEPGQVAPITDRDPHDEVPLPEEPPDEEDFPAPPEEEGPETTVDPITGS